MNVVTNMQLVTKELSIINNGLPDGEFAMKPLFRRNIGTTGDGKYFTELSVEIINTEETPFPVDLRVKIAGIFDLEDKEDEYIDIFLKVNAVQILFPYLRTMVTNAMTTALMTPIMLPVINPETLFPDD